MKRTTFLVLYSLILAVAWTVADEQQWTYARVKKITASVERNVIGLTFERPVGVGIFRVQIYEIDRSDRTNVTAKTAGNRLSDGPWLGHWHDCDVTGNLKDVQWWIVTNVAPGQTFCEKIRRF